MSDGVTASGGMVLDLFDDLLKAECWGKWSFALLLYTLSAEDSVARRI